MSAKVYQVVELIPYKDGQKQQTAYILAENIKEAAEIVGEDESRTIIQISEVSEISRIPGERYSIEPIAKQP